ncbi:MAG TPA: hypothetical protein VE133_12865 [Candidatus Sulfotelmatobacter sp.]|nr:hypothetical protein [Candidatus Sulfotelmatobacter sp.]
MKKLLTIAFTLLLGASLSFAQDAGSKGTDTTDRPATAKATTKSGKKAHKGGKKTKSSSKKGSESSSTPK